jgi:hypothetical protein
MEGKFFHHGGGNPSTTGGEILPRSPISFHDRAGNSSTIGEEILPPYRGDSSIERGKSFYHILRKAAPVLGVSICKQ